MLESGQLNGGCQLTPRVVNRPGFAYYRFSSHWPLALGFSLAGLIYGGLHLVAWNAPFPSELEMILWRCSGVILAASGYIPLLFALYRKVNVGRWSRQHHHWRLTKLEWVSRWFCGWILRGLVSLSCLLYGATRVYLVTECFINIAHLPDSVFDVPSWS